MKGEALPAILIILLIFSSLSASCIQLKVSEAASIDADENLNSSDTLIKSDNNPPTLTEKTYSQYKSEKDQMPMIYGSWKRRQQQASQKKLWVDYFDNTENTSWIFTGDNPYLHNDTDSYIMSFGTGNCSWFQFQQTNLTASQTVYLIIEWRTINIKPTEEAKLYLNNSTSEVDLGSFNLTLEYRWTEINVTSALRSISEINNAKLRVASLYAGLYVVAVRRAYLRIYNGPVPVGFSTVMYSKPGGQVTLSIKWTDLDGLSSYALNHNASGGWATQNLTGTLGGIEDWSNHTITVQRDTTSVLAYQFWANDTNNKWEETETFFLYPVKNFSPELLQHIENVSGSPIGHSYGRKTFFDNVTQRFWKFYSDGTNMKYTSTEDGQTWRPSETVRSAENGFEFYVHNFNGTVHYIYNSEGTGDNVYYRKGVLNTNGTITWVSVEQVAVDASTSKRFYACSVVTDTSGFPFLVFGNRTEPNSKTLSLIKSELKNGTWQTASGFPLQINENPDSDLVSGVALSLPNNQIYVVYASSGNEEPIKGRLWSNSVLRDLENASDYTMPSNYPFSAVSDSYGNVHLIYRRVSSRVDYGFRNYTTRDWEIKDEWVTSHLTSESLDSTIYSWPVIGWNPDSEKIYVHWWTLDDKSAWLKMRNSTGWEQRRRIIRLDSDATLVDGDVVAAESHRNRTLMSFVVQNVIDGHKEVWAYLYANRPPLASFTESAETAYTGEIIIFNANESYDADGIIASYFWNFGDGANATAVIVEYAYADNGNYTVTLIVTDDDGATNSISAIKTIFNRPPLASFTESAETVYTGESIVFNASESYDHDGMIISYFWDLGDGSNATEVSVEHAYADDGNYTVMLTVTDDDGVEDTATSIKTALNRDPVALFTESAETVYTGDVIAFNASDSYDLDGSVVSYFWDFGDGHNVTGTAVIHAYSDDDSYIVTLTVIDDDNATATASASKTVLNRAPIAVFTESAETLLTGEAIYFNASESYDADGVIVSYFWDLGDDSNSTGVAVEHVYTEVGNYTITLTVTDDDNSTNTVKSTKVVLSHDVAVQTVVPFKTVVGTGFNVNVNVTVENQGNFTETFVVAAYSNGTLMDTPTVIALTSGQVTTITFTWNTTGFDLGNHSISAYAWPVSGEFDWADNSLVDGWVFVTIVGDVDGDRDVDIFDIVAMSGSYGAVIGDVKYEPVFDIDGDGDIDIFDIVAAATNYGESW